MVDAFHTRLRASRFLQRFTAFTRVLLAVGFFAPGLTKLFGHRFTQLTVDTQVGAFFEVFFQAQAFYMFVGLAQVTAALLLLWPRTATLGHLGAVLYAPIIANITVITWAIGFGGTRWITVLMLLACLWLLVWDWDRLRAILPRREASGGQFGPREYILQSLMWGLGGIAATGTAAVLGIVGPSLLLVAAALGIGGAVFGLVVAWHVRQLPAPRR